MKDRIMRVFWAAVLMIGVIGNLAACGKVTKTNGGQVKAALDKDCERIKLAVDKDYVFTTLDGEWKLVDGNGCLKVVFDCNSDKKTVTFYDWMYRNNDKPELAACEAYEISKLYFLDREEKDKVFTVKTGDYPQNDDVAVEFVVVSEGDDNSDYKFTLDTQNEKLWIESRDPGLCLEYSKQKQK